MWLQWTLLTESNCNICGFNGHFSTESNENKRTYSQALFSLCGARFLHSHYDRELGCSRSSFPIDSKRTLISTAERMHTTIQDTSSADIRLPTTQKHDKNKRTE